MALAAVFCCVTSARAQTANDAHEATPSDAHEATPTPSISDLERRLAAQEARLRDQEARLRDQEARLRDQDARLHAAEHTQAATTVRPPPREPAFGFSNDGFYLGAKSSFQIRLRGIIQADARAYFDTGTTAIPSQFIIRRARPIVEGTVADLLDFRIVPDFGLGQALLYDAFVDIRPWRFIALRVGKFKSPFGLERLQNDAFLMFAERGLPSDLVPDRDIGASLHGDLAGGAFLWEVAAFDGALDNNGANQDGDTNDGKDFVVRLFGHPLRPLRSPWVYDLGVGAAASYGKQHGTASLPGVGSYRTTGQNVFFAYLFDSTAIRPTVIAISDHYRFSPQLYWYVGPFGLLAEYVYDSVTVSNSLAGAAPRTTLVNQAWQVAVAGVLTGERAGYNGLAPRRPFNLRKLHFGAVELLARYGQLVIDPSSFPMYADPTKSAGSALEWGVGVNWYLLDNFKILIDYERTTFHGGGGQRGAFTGDRQPENALFARTQVFF